MLNSQKRKKTDVIAIYEEGDLLQLQCSGVAQIDLDSNKIIGFEEKPLTLKSNLSVPVFYIINAQTLPLSDQCLKERLNPDAPVNCTPYLIKHNETYAYVFEG